jgi:nucleoside-diphosphate-sugar epimerase
MSRITVLGASGFVGRHFVARARAAGHTVATPPRGDLSLFDDDAGHVIYCVGMTADFRRRPYDTVDAHIGLLTELLRRGRFASLLYLSSTRVYQRSTDTKETATLSARPEDPSDLYNLSKMMGESLCLSRPEATVRAARLSNVYGVDPGSENFLPSILRDALERGHVTLGLGRGSEKDYVAVEDVADALLRIALEGRERLYNVASGENVSNGALLDALAALTGARVDVTADAPEIRFPPIDVSRLAGEFDWRPRRLPDELPRLLEGYRRAPSHSGEARMRARKDERSP